MENNSTFGAKGINTVRLKMLEGIIRILKNVKHVPGLQKNLIFFYQGWTRRDFDSVVKQDR